MARQVTEEEMRIMEEAENGEPDSPQDIEQAVPEPDVDAVVIQVNRQGDDSSVVVTRIGDVRLTEIESIIKLGLKQWREAAALSE